MTQDTGVGVQRRDRPPTICHYHINTTLRPHGEDYVGEMNVPSSSVKCVICPHDIRHAAILRLFGCLADPLPGATNGYRSLGVNLHNESQLRIMKGLFGPKHTSEKKSKSKSNSRKVAIL